MRKRTKQLASLLTALILVFSLLPTALAYQKSCSYSGCPSYVSGNNWKQYDNTYHYDTCYQNGHTNYEMHTFSNNVCTACGYVYNSYYNNTNGYSTTQYCSYCGGNRYGYWRYDTTSHYFVCNTCNKSNYYGSHTNYGYCTTCGYNYTYNNGYYNTCTCVTPSLNSAYTYMNSAYHAQYCRTCGGYRNLASHVNNGSGYCTVCNAYISTGTSSSICSNYLSSTGWISKDSTEHYQVCPHCNQTYTQAHSFNTSGACTVCGYNKYTYTGANGVYTLSVPYSSGTFSFTDATTSNGVSFYSLLMQDLSKYAINSTNLGSYTITFSNYASHVATLYNANYGYNNSYTTCYLSNLSSLYLNVLSTGTWSGYYTVNYANSNSTVMSGSLTITFGSAGSTSGNIIYSATQGDSVKLMAEDFQTFWKQNNNGSLSYVQITSISGVSGTLCYNHTASEKSHTNALKSIYHISPSGNQSDLNKLTFVPTKNSTGTTYIQFVAYGNSGNSASVTPLSGSIAITYTKSDVAAITYNVFGSTTLDSDDFTKVYKVALGNSTASPSFTIKLLDLPEYGTLYTGYSSSNSKGTKLTASNIAAMTFTNSDSGTNAIGNITYVRDSAKRLSDSINYAVYSGNTLQYMGKMTFYAKELSISYESDLDGVRFDDSDFYSGASALPKTTYISFGTPSSGTLYRSYASGKGTAAKKTDLFSYNGASGTYELEKVTYIPEKGYNGTVKIPVYIGTSGVSAGTVSIEVKTNPFTDVPSNAYYHDAVLWAVQNEITNGTSDTTFSPKNTCNRGDVVTFLWRAKGSPEPKSTTNPFTDVKKDDYFYKAVLWAVEQGITNGMTETTFGPKVECTSGHVITFLWRAEGKPTASTTDTAYYAQAVAWANANKLLSGTDTAFAPNNNSPRADIVTYLYRVIAEEN